MLRALLAPAVLAVSLAAGAVTLLLGGPGDASAQQAPQAGTVWLIPTPFGSASSRPRSTGQAVIGPEAAFTANNLNGIRVQFRRMRWTRWGAPKVTARGQARYCTPDGCLRFRAVTLILMDRRAFCAGIKQSSAREAQAGVTQRRYGRYRFTGIPPLKGGRTLRSGRETGCKDGQPVAP